MIDTHHTLSLGTDRNGFGGSHSPNLILKPQELSNLPALILASECPPSVINTEPPTRKKIEEAMVKIFGSFPKWFQMKLLARFHKVAGPSTVRAAEVRVRHFLPSATVRVGRTTGVGIIGIIEDEGLCRELKGKVGMNIGLTAKRMLLSDDFKNGRSKRLKKERLLIIEAADLGLGESISIQNFLSFITTEDRMNAWSERNLSNARIRPCFSDTASRWRLSYVNQPEGESITVVSKLVRPIPRPGEKATEILHLFALHHDLNDRLTLEGVPLAASITEKFLPPGLKLAFGFETLPKRKWRSVKKTASLLTHVALDSFSQRN